MKGIIISGWVEIRRLPEAEAEHSLKGSDKPLLMEKVLNFYTVNSVMKRYNLKICKGSAELKSLSKSHVYKYLLVLEKSTGE